MLYKLLLLSVLFFSWSSEAKLAATPGLINTKKTKSVVFGKEIERIIKKERPGFSPLKISVFKNEVIGLFKGSKNNIPMAVVGDFNGDKINDLVVLGKNKKNFELLAFLSEKSTFKLVPVAQWTMKNFLKAFYYEKKIVRYLSFVPKSKVKKPKNYKNDLFQIETYLGFTELFFFDGKKFQSNDKGHLELKNP